jgi:hypothetical protein
MAIQNFTPEPIKDPAQTRNNEMARVVFTQIQAENKTLKKQLAQVLDAIKKLNEGE